MKYREAGRPGSTLGGEEGLNTNTEVALNAKNTYYIFHPDRNLGKNKTKQLKAYKVICMLEIRGR